MRRRLLLNLASLEAEEPADVRETLKALLAVDGRKARMTLERSCIRMTPHAGDGAIDLDYDMLPRGMRSRAGCRMHRAELENLPQRLALMMLEPSTTWFDRNSPDASDWTSRWDGWTDLQMVAEALVPDFLERDAEATDGTPWTTAECLARHDGGRAVLPHRLVEHVFSAHPHVMTLRRRDAADARRRSWAIGRDGPLGFEAVQPDPMRTMRLLAGIPPHLLEAMGR